MELLGRYSNECDASDSRPLSLVSDAIIEEESYRRVTAHLRTVLGNATYEAAFRAGQEIETSDIVALALAA